MNQKVVQQCPLSAVEPYWYGARQNLLSPPHFQPLTLCRWKTFVDAFYMDYILNVYTSRTQAELLHSTPPKDSALWMNGYPFFTVVILFILKFRQPFQGVPFIFSLTRTCHSPGLVCCESSSWFTGAHPLFNHHIDRPPIALRFKGHVMRIVIFKLYIFYRMAGQCVTGSYHPQYTNY